MLNVDKLKDEIATAIRNIVIPAIETIELSKQPVTSNEGTELAKKVSSSFDEMVTDQLADVLANAIHCYIKNMNITGTIITVGNKFTQTAKIAPAGTPVVGGKIPNTFGVS